MCGDLFINHDKNDPVLKQSVFYIHPGRLTWNLRIHPWKRRNIFQTIIFRFYVNLGGCNGKYPAGFFFLWLTCVGYQSKLSEDGNSLSQVGFLKKNGWRARMPKVLAAKSWLRRPVTFNCSVYQLGISRMGSILWANLHLLIQSARDQGPETWLFRVCREILS